MRSTHRLFAMAVLALVASRTSVTAQIAVTLSPAASPASGQAGTTIIIVTGSGFPAGTILPANTTVSLQPAAGGAAVTTNPTLVTIVVGSTRRVTFLIPALISVSTPTAYLVGVSGTTSDNTAFASTNKATLTINPPPSISSVSPTSGQVGQTLSVTVTGQFTNFTQGSTQANFGPGIAVGTAAEGAFGPVTVTNATTATAPLKINAAAASGLRSVSIQTGTQQATRTNVFTVNPVTTQQPTITDFSPKSAPAGTLVTLSGTNLAPNPSVTLSKQGGGTINAIPASSSAGSLSFTIPTGAATGPITVTVGTQPATSAVALTITTSSTFTISALPATVNLIRGQSASYAVQLSSGNGFSQLAQLAVTGVPAGIGATFKPQVITAGQTSVLTLTAPTNQGLGSSSLTVTSTATVDGMPLSSTVGVQMAVQSPTTSFIGRTVVDDAVQTPLASVTVTMLGKNGSGGTTGCTGSVVSDAAGNFALQSLPGSCVGLQLVGFDGLTATSPPGKYAGVNLIYTLASGQVTASPVLVHLPRIDNQETFLVTQNSSVDQSYAYRSIPGLSLTVYRNTTFTMPDGTQPNPFPLVAVQVPVDRLPDAKPPVPTMMLVFIVAFQPANVNASQPVAVYYPNTLNTAPGINMPLLTLDPTLGKMVPYGTGTVSADGTQVIPDPDPAHAGHRYGIVHFDWHGQMPPAPPPNQQNPGPPGAGGPTSGGPNSGPGSGPGQGQGPGGPTPPPPATTPPNTGSRSCGRPLPWSR